MDADRIQIDDRVLSRSIIADGLSHPRREWFRTMLVYGVPLGGLLREAMALGASIHALLMDEHATEWHEVMGKAEALAGRDWRIGETCEIATRHLWGLWVPSDMYEWRTFRNMRAAKQVEADYFTPTKEHHGT